MTEQITEDRFWELLGTFERDAFRLETQDAYALDYERADFEAFLHGTPLSPDAGWFREWLDLVTAHTGAGQTMARVRILAEPPTDYQRWLVSGTPWYNQASEDIRYMPRSRAVALGLPLNADWWLLDDQRLILMRFDGAGEVTSMELVTEPGAIARHQQWRDLAVRNATAAEEIYAA